MYRTWGGEDVRRRLRVQLIRTTNWKSGYPAIGKVVKNRQDEISATGACTRRITVTWARVSFL